MKKMMEISAAHLTSDFNAANLEMEHRVINKLDDLQIRQCLNGTGHLPFPHTHTHIHHVTVDLNGTASLLMGRSHINSGNTVSI